VARDDWRLRIELPEEEGAGAFLQRIGIDLGSEARELARELERERLAVTHDADTVFVYTPSRLQADQARRIVEAELKEQGLEPDEIVLEHWLADGDRWEAVRTPALEGEQAEEHEESGEASPTHPRESWEDDVLARGYAPWEVRVECPSTREAKELEEQLEGEGYSVSRAFTFVIVGANSREEAAELAGRLHGEVEPGGELVYEVAPQNPFAVFGGLGGAGTPL
jgi:hypothetical protein